MPHRHFLLGLAPQRFGEAAWPMLMLAQEHLTVHLNTETGATQTTVAGLPEYKFDGEEALKASGLQCRTLETADGPVSELSDSSGWSVQVHGTYFQGSFQGDLIVAIFVLPGDSWTCVGLVRGGTEAPLRLPVGSFARVSGPLVICPELCCVHMFERSVEGIRCVSVPGPQGTSDARLDGQHLSIVGDKEVVSVDLDEVPRRRRHSSVSLECVHIQPPRNPLAEPAEVLFVFPSTLVAQHPQVGRLTLERDKVDISKGDWVRIEDVREDHPGIFKVVSWRKVGGESAKATHALTVALAAPELAPIGPAEISAAQQPTTSEGSADTLRALAEEFGFRAPPLLLRLLDLCETDVVFAGWMDKCGIAYVGIHDLSDWSADPCLLAFAGNGGGDEHALYLYPPSYDPKVEPPVVTYLHEVNASEFVAQDFESYFEHLLGQSEEWGAIDSALAARICERMQFKRDLRPVGTAPSYILPEVSETEPEDEERCALHHYLQDDSQESLERLQAIYGRLEWELPLRHLRSLGEES